MAQVKSSMSAAEARKELSSQLQTLFHAIAPEGEYPSAVTGCQVYKLPSGAHTKKGQKKTVALARVVLNDSMQLTGIRVVAGVNGLFVAYPGDPSYKGDEYRSLFYPVTRKLRELIENTVLTRYKELP